MKYKPSDIKLVEVISREKNHTLSQAIDVFGAAEYEWIATKLVRDSQEAECWIYTGPFREPFVSETHCLNYMKDMCESGWLDQEEGQERYRLSESAVERIVTNFPSSPGDAPVFRQLRLQLA